MAEILVAIAIFAIIVLAALLAYDRSNRDFKQGVEASNLQQNTRVAFDKLVADLRSAGFDFDRDGIPAGSVGGVNQYQQPDEQFEYIGPAAVTIRGNFDHETERTPCPALSPDNCDNGRERTLESTQFPVVTTANDEIVTYALVPDSQSSIPTCDPATNCIQFYADVKNPRESYPGGEDEQLVQIPGVDLGTVQKTGTYIGQTCSDDEPCVVLDNPPYTLYRFTLDRDQEDFEDGANVIRTPLATGIRRISLRYFQDPQGFDPLKNVVNTTDVSTGDEVRGEGIYNVDAPGAKVDERIIRSKVNSLRLVLVGMNESPDPQYTLANEIPAAQRYRQYRLETLIAPRNIQKRGMKEQDTIAPGSPTDLEVCTGRCGGIYLTWTAPAVNATQGAPDQYQVIFDINDVALNPNTSSFRFRAGPFTSTFGYVFADPIDFPQMIPNVEYRFRVVALNTHGSGTSTSVTATPLNATKPSEPTSLTATASSGKVTLQWSRPMVDESGTMSGASCSGLTAAPASEIYGYRIERTIDPSGSWDVVAAESTVRSTSDTVTWTDTTVRNCVEYHYRVSAVERCQQDDAYNTTNDADDGISNPSNVANATAPAEDDPKAPTSFVIDQNSPNSGGLAQVNMTWGKVSQDVQDNPINVSGYRVYRKKIAPAGSEEVSFTRVHEMLEPADAATYTWTNANVPTGSNERYEWYVTALQCPSDEKESVPSDIQKFPCTFSTDALNATDPLVSNAFDGGGMTDVDPWLVVDTAEVTVNTNVSPTTAAVSATAAIYTEGGTLVTTLSDASAPFVFSWTVASNEINRIDVSVVDANGCTKSLTRWVSDEAQACCLTPRDADSTVLKYTAGNDFVEVILKNVCGGALDIEDVTITWDSTLSGGNRPDRVFFPTASGTDFTSTGNPPATFTVAPGGSVIDVPAGSTDYTIKIRFNGTLSNAQSPVTGFSVDYVRSGELSTESCPLFAP